MLGGTNTMSEFHLTTTTDETFGVWRLSRDEAATLWYALSEYRNDLAKSATAAVAASNVEDQMFLFTTAGQVARLMFELRDDHPAHTPTQDVRKWLDTE
jgi:hypothetical protein